MAKQPEFKEVLEEIRRLWAKNHLHCGWFLRDDLTIDSKEDAKYCLALLIRHGDRATYMAARKLQRWL